MGYNGSGKSTLSGVLAGDPRFTVNGGTATFHGVDLLSLAPEGKIRTKACSVVPVPGGDSGRDDGQLHARRHQRQSANTSASSL